jgi:two-component system nitrogen regulation sensor histidine kinase GlnL
VSNLNQSLLSELTTGIVILDTSLRVKFINSSALNILDTTEKTSLKQKLDQIFFEEPESLHSFQEALDQKRSFTKTDAVLNLKRGTKVLCTYIVHPFTDDKETGLLIEIINKEASSELNREI